MYYVYEIFIKETNEIIYVGKGTGNRYKSKKKNKMLNRLMEENECETRITNYFDKEEYAFEAERQRIVELKEKNQAICNNAVYSTGGVGYVWDEKRRKEKSVNNPMKRPEQRERMSKNNPMKNSETAKIVSKKKSHEVFVGDKKYPSIKMCAKCLCVSETTVSNWIKKGFTSSGEKIYSVPYCEKDHNIETIEYTGKIIYDGKEYFSVKEMSLETGLNCSVIRHWLRKGYSSEGIICKRKDDKRNIVIPENIHSSKKIPVVINGVEYKSISDAVKNTGMTRSYINKTYRK